MTQNKLTLLIPAYLSTKTDSVAGAASVKQILSAAFTDLPPPQAGEPAQSALLLADLCTLIDRLFLARVTQKAELTGAIKVDRRSDQ